MKSLRPLRIAREKGKWLQRLELESFMILITNMLQKSSGTNQA